MLAADSQLFDFTARNTDFKPLQVVQGFQRPFGVDYGGAMRMKPGEHHPAVFIGFFQVFPDERDTIWPGR